MNIVKRQKQHSARLHSYHNHSILLLMGTEKATFGAGCFWGVEETFRNLKGVLSTASGYAAGRKRIRPTKMFALTRRATPKSWKWNSIHRKLHTTNFWTFSGRTTTPRH